ncbi:MAG: 7-carboxy-7-deazaguanine synthase QueE [Candidatus Porifericomitaceae bacterium WSBS_2022_MAG_OTU9]
MPDTLRITEIFHSIQGESVYCGWPTVFVRLTGCPLRCSYCDTAYAFTGGQSLSLQQISTKAATYGASHVTVTGGEPLAQNNALALLELLCDQGYKVSLETGGALPVDKVDRRVMLVMDLKTPGSKEQQRNLYSNLEHLKPQDQVKFVICDHSDYGWAVQTMEQYQLQDKCTVLFSPCHDRLAPTELASWMLSDQIPARLQLQMHKYIWGDVPGR